MSARKRLVLNIGLAKLLGFARDEFEPGKTYIADEPHRIAIHREICVHLAEISTSDNQHNGRPSSLLRSVPVGNEKCGGGRTETFRILQYKRLESGTFPQLTRMVLDVSGKRLSFDYLVTFGGRLYHVVLDVHAYIRVMVSCMCSMIRDLDIRDPASAASLYLVTHRTQSKAACRP